MATIFNKAGTMGTSTPPILHPVSTVLKSGVNFSLPPSSCRNDKHERIRLFFHEKFESEISKWNHGMG
jgi:hypothetical protein